MMATASSCFALEEKFTEKFETTDEMDAVKTTANWSAAAEPDGFLALADSVNANVAFSGAGWEEGVAVNGDSFTDNSSAAALGDLNGDGELDLVVVNQGGVNKVHINNNGGVSGNFALAANVGNEADDSSSLAIGDVNGDGFLDVVAGNQNQANKLYLNNGSGVFPAAGVVLDTDEDYTRGVALGDVDGDADLDLVVANAGQNNKLYLNDGEGNFEQVGTAIGIEVDITTSLVLFDLSGNGALDVIVGNASADASGTINRVYMNDGSGGFSQAGVPFAISDSDDTTALAIGDVDDDGDIDLVVANFDQANKLYLNNGAGSLVSSGVGIGEVVNDAATETDASSSIAMMDVDNDGDLDVVVGNYSQVNKLYLNEGAGQFTNAGIDLVAGTNDSNAVCLGDVDSDGDLDVLAANNGQNQFYENGRGGGFIEAGKSIAAGVGADVHAVTSIALADLDGNHGLDIVVGMYNQANKVYLQNFDGSFPAKGDDIGIDFGVIPLPSGEADPTYGVAIGDVDGVNGPDIVVGNYGQVNKLYLNDGNGKFNNLNVSALGTNDADNTYSIILGDVDGVNGPDIVVGNNNQFNKLYLNDGSGGFPVTGTDIGSEEDYTYQVVLVNVDSNGGADTDLDLIVANAGQTNKIYFNGGSGFNGATTAIDIGSEDDGSSSLTTGDINGDSIPDLVVGNYAEENRFYLNDGNGVFDLTGTAIGSDTDNTRGVDLADVDNDGDMDLLVANDGQANKIYLNNGDSTFLASGMPIGSEQDASRYIKLIQDVDDDLFEVGTKADKPAVLVGNYEQDTKYYNSVAYRTHAGIAVSTKTELDGVAVRTAVLTRGKDDVVGNNASVQYFLSNNGGNKWHPVKSGQAFVFPEKDNDLRWKVELKSLSPVRSPVLDSIDVKNTNLLPVFTATPGIEGVFAVEETLTVVNAEATDAEDGDIDVSYEWLFVDGEAVSPVVGATGSTYVITSGDIDKKIKVKVTAVDADNGTTEEFTNTVSKTSYVAPTPDPDAEADPEADATADEAVADVVDKRTGGASLSGLSLLGLMLLLVWRLLVFRQSRRIAGVAV